MQPKILLLVQYLADVKNNLFYYQIWFCIFSAISCWIIYQDYKKCYLSIYLLILWVILVSCAPQHLFWLSLLITEFIMILFFILGRLILKKNMLGMGDYLLWACALLIPPEKLPNLFFFAGVITMLIGIYKKIYQNDSITQEENIPFAPGIIGAFSLCL